MMRVSPEEAADRVALANNNPTMRSTFALYFKALTAADLHIEDDEPPCRIYIPSEDKSQGRVNRLMRSCYSLLEKEGYTDEEIMGMIFEWWENE